MLPSVSEALVAFLRDRAGGPPVVVGSLTWPILREIHDGWPAQPLAAIVGPPKGAGEGHRGPWRPPAPATPGPAPATPERLRDIAAAGHETYVWTVNDADAARRLAGEAVAALITDVPGAIAEALR